MLSNHQPPPPAAERLRASLVNASDSALCRGEELLPGRTNYLIGNDPSKWRRNVRHYARVRCEQVYAGIDVVYYGGDKGMEFDFVVGPNADASQAQMSFDGGVSKLETSEIGHLRLHTAAGLVVQRKPVVYQEVEGERVEVAADYVLQDDNRAAFRLGEYNPALPLVIDPVLDWATFLGGSGDDGIQNITADDQGNVYVVGRTASANFPTEGPYQGALTGPGDIFVAKLSPDGSQVIFATYLGGSGLDIPGGIAVDAEGNVYVSGGTASANFPTTAGTIQPDFGGQVDAFVAKLNAQGSDLIYATFLGGGAQDIGTGLRLDESNHAYVIGSTDGEGFPVTEGVLQSTYGGQFDTFVSKVDPAGATLVYSTLFGGNGSEIPADVELNAQGEVHIAGIASSTDFPGTPGAYQEAIVVGTFDAFVAKFNAAGTEVEYLSFLGGSGDDEASGLSLDSLNNVWLSGGTSSNDFPTTQEAPNTNYLGGESDGFLARLPLPQGMLLGLEGAAPAKGGAPTIAPLVTYIGSDLRNFGLDVLVRDGGVGGASKGTVLDRSVRYSLSNVAVSPTEVNGEFITGPFGQTWTLDFNGVPVGDPLTTVGGEFRKLTLDGQGSILGGGAALPDAPVTGGTVDPEHNGGLDGWLGKFLEPPNPFESDLELEKRLLYPRDGIIYPFQEVRYEVIVTLVSGPDADVTLMDTLEGMDLEAIFPSPRLPSVREERRFFETDNGSTTTEFPASGVACQSNPPGDGRTVTECRRRLSVGESIRLLVHTRVTVDPGMVAQNKAVADDPSGAPVMVMLEHEVQDTPGEINEVICQAVCDDGTALGLHPEDEPAKGEDTDDDPCYRALIRAGSLAELLRSFKVLCEGSSDLPDPLPVSVRYGIQLPITSKIIDGETGFSEAVVLSGDFEAGEHRVLAPGITPTGNENVFPGLIGTGPGGAGSAFWPGALIYLNAQGMYEFNIANVRVDTTDVDLTTIVQEVIVTTETAVAPISESSTGEITLDLIETLPTTRVYQDHLQLVPGMEAQIAETEVSQFRQRYGDLGLFDSRDNEYFFSESGFIPDHPLGDRDDPNGIGVALSGTRIVITLEDLPLGLTSAFVSTCLESESSSGSGATERLGARLVAGVNTDYSGGTMMDVCDDDYERFFKDNIIGIPYEIIGGGADVLDAFTVPIQLNCPPDAQGQGKIDTFLAPVERIEVVAGRSFPVFGRSSTGVKLFNWEDACRGSAFEAEQIKQPGIVNAATLLFEDLPVAGSLFAVGYQNGEGIATGFATSVPLPDRINGVEVIIHIDNPPREKLQKAVLSGAEIQGFYRAPLLFVSPTQINAQFPWEIDSGAGVVEGHIIANGVLSEAFEIAVGAFSPGIFTFDFGPGRAIVTNLDTTVAQAEGTLDDFPMLTARPASTGEFIVILATGLGPVNPPAVTGDNSLDENGNFIQRDVVEQVRVFIGGVEATVVFAGLSPEFVGVYQLNVEIAPGTPVGDAVSIVIEVGGVRSRDDVTIAVAP